MSHLAEIYRLFALPAILDIDIMARAINIFGNVHEGQ